MNKLDELDSDSISWKYIKREGLDLEYAVAMPETLANNIFEELENTLEYFTGDLTKIK